MAEAQIAAGQYAVAVVIAQVAVETLVESAFRLLLSVNVPMSTQVLMDLLPDRSFMDKRTRQLWEHVTGDKISKADGWKDYHPHVERRNRAAHGNWMGFPDEAITRTDAEDGVAATRKLIGHIHEVMTAQFDALFARELDPWRSIRVLNPRPAEWEHELPPWKITPGP